VLKVIRGGRRAARTVPPPFHAAQVKAGIPYQAKDTMATNPHALLA